MVMVMGILTESFSPAALTVFSCNILQESFFLLRFFADFREIHHGGDTY